MTWFWALHTPFIKKIYLRAVIIYFPNRHIVKSMTLKKDCVPQANYFWVEAKNLSAPGRKNWNPSPSERKPHPLSNFSPCSPVIMYGTKEIVQNDWTDQRVLHFKSSKGITSSGMRLVAPTLSSWCIKSTGLLGQLDVSFLQFTLSIAFSWSWYGKGWLKSMKSCVSESSSSQHMEYVSLDLSTWYQDTGRAVIMVSYKVVEVYCFKQFPFWHSFTYTIKWNIISLIIPNFLNRLNSVVSTISGEPTKVSVFSCYRNHPLEQR